MNNEKLRADIQVVIQYAPNHPLSELLNRCYVALGELDTSMLPDGWQLVPVEPTPEMMNAGCAAPLNKAARHNSCYRAMLAAAPSAPAAQGGE